MPRYKYKCTECDHEEVLELPISSNPKEKRLCKFCEAEHPDTRPYTELTMTRRISLSSSIVERETLGKWYKEQTGKELLGG